MSGTQAVAEITLCPTCEAPQTTTADLMLNELITCAECSSELEVVSLQPLTLTLAPPCEEDWGE